MAPGEYRAEEFETLLRAFYPSVHTGWRPWVALMLCGHHGMRANAVLHLRWEDIAWDADEIIWPARWQKNGEPHRQPLTWEAVSALETARRWREKLGYTGPWVLFSAQERRDRRDVRHTAISRSGSRSGRQRTAQVSGTRRTVRCTGSG